ncbi:MBL fold metallo-hydrolase [Enterovirga rhinocerotis]|uniref:Glyoxylase-like metal-dependent hydrolase (Beta-lactamase superfamily II) n=1 Tax=Enterovirga rhinocerotis TaxID=1339210 RepID=A0A4R7C1L2_9HYPH|nr:MBL fold metallo-hydrolase [Enterovirga rhinocerotis]TDR90407.1 glyoxylase-like metal-dependent hydrolase (beta-lactamase superfamily II) [Enterovirga rhinocerotis]
MADFNIQVVPVTPFQQNCSLAWSAATKRGVVVDPGGDVAVIRQAIEKAGITVDFILLTHGHIDHAGGAAELAEALGVGVVGPHELEQPLLDKLEEQGRKWGMDGVRAVKPGRYLAEGDTIEIAGVTFHALHCPGHSPGSVVLFSPALRFAFMGDVLFQGSVGRTDLPGGSHEQLISAIKTKVLPLGDDVSFLPGHGPGSTIGQERATNLFLR